MKRLSKRRDPGNQSVVDQERLPEVDHLADEALMLGDSIAARNDVLLEDELCVHAQIGAAAHGVGQRDGASRGDGAVARERKSGGPTGGHGRYLWVPAAESPGAVGDHGAVTTNLAMLENV